MNMPRKSWQPLDFLIPKQSTEGSPLLTSSLQCGIQHSQEMEPAGAQEWRQCGYGQSPTGKGQSKQKMSKLESPAENTFL